MPAPSRFDGLSRLPLVSGWAGTGVVSTSCGCPPCVCCTGTDQTPVLAASMEQRAGPPEPRPAGPSTHPQPKVSPGLATQRWPGPPIPVPIPISTPEPGAHPAVPCCVAGGDAVGCPRHPLAAGRAGHGRPANPALQRDAGCSPHATGRGHRQPQRGGRCGDATRLEPAARCVLGQGGHPGAGGTLSHVSQPRHGGPEHGGGGWVLQWVSDGSPQGTVHLVVLGGQG